jgi:hypothetical protein
MANTENSRESRFAIIESLLLWEGEISNERVREILGIQKVQASRVLSEYIAYNPDHIDSNTLRSPYKAQPNIIPKHSTGSIEEYISIAKFFDSSDELIVDARYDLTTPTAEIISHISSAIRKQCGLKINYLSMTNPNGMNRIIYPHTIVRAGRRWHVRAWCGEKIEYRDFVIGRIKNASIIETVSKNTIVSDVDWNNKVELIIRAHPKLNSDQAAVIKYEFFSGSTSRKLLIRSCLLQYVIQDIRAAIDCDKELPPEYQLAVLNLSDVKSYLF